MLIRRYFIYILFVYSLLMLSCNGEQGDADNSSALPKARGAAGEVVLVMDSVAWKGELGDEVRETFMKAVPGLPQPEPYFDLRYVDPSKLNSVLRSARNMLYVTTLDNDSPAGRKIRSYFTESSIKRIQEDPDLFMYPKSNEFARGQEVLYLFGETKEELINNLEKNRERVRNFFSKVERERLQKNLYKAKEEKSISKHLLKKHQFNIRIPFGYELVPLEEGENFVWIRQLGQEVDKSVVVYYEDYTSEEAFKPDNIIALRNRITEKYIADSETVHMVLQEQVPVEFDTVNFNGKFAVEARGLWKLNNNSMGGPFLSYTFVDENLGRLYYLEGFVYSPGEKKRPHIREIETILHTFRTEAEYKEKNSTS